MKTSTNYFALLAGGIILVSILFQNCAPVFSELQDARTAGKGNIELTTAYGSTNLVEEGDGSKVQNQLGLQAAFGVSPAVDIRARFEYVWVESEHVSVIGIGPKFSLLKDHIAFSLPVGRALGEGSTDTWQLHPTLLFSIPLKKNIIDLNLSSKYLYSFCEDCEGLVAFNMGFSISNDLNSWAIRPEYGLLYNPDAAGHYSQFSIGVSKVFGKNPRM